MTMYTAAAVPFFRVFFLCYLRYLFFFFAGCVHSFLWDFAVQCFFIYTLDHWAVFDTIYIFNDISCDVNCNLYRVCYMCITVCLPLLRDSRRHLVQVDWAEVPTVNGFCLHASAAPHAEPVYWYGSSRLCNWGALIVCGLNSDGA